MDAFSYEFKFPSCIQQPDKTVFHFKYNGTEIASAGIIPFNFTSGHVQLLLQVEDDKRTG